MDLVEKVGSKVVVLLVIDMQNDFCDPNGVMAKRGFDVAAIPPMATRLGDLIEAARNFDVPIVWVQTTHDETTSSSVWLARHDTTLRSTNPPETNCWTGSWGAEFWGVSPLAAETVVIKHRYSAFANTSLEWVLRTLERRSLLVTGVSTEACIESTVRDGFFHEYHVNLVEDCCSSYSRQSHDATVRNVRRLFGLTPSSTDIVAQWKAEASA